MNNPENQINMEAALGQLEKIFDTIHLPKTDLGNLPTEEQIMLTAARCYRLGKTFEATIISETWIEEEPTRSTNFRRVIMSEGEVVGIDYSSIVKDVKEITGITDRLYKEQGFDLALKYGNRNKR